MAWTEPPEMEVGHLKMKVIQRLADISREAGMILHVQEHQPRLPEQVHRPARDNDRAQNPYEGVEKLQSERRTKAERCKGEQ